MQNWCIRLAMTCIAAIAAIAQEAPPADKISVTGTLIPQQLLVQNYGTMPKGITGYDLSVCNVSTQKQTVISTEIYQQLTKENISVTPIGKQIMLAAILRNQSHNWNEILSVALTSATGTMALLSTSSTMNVPGSLKTTIGLSALMFGQVSSALKPVTGADKVEKFEREVLESALVLDTGSCAERTLFAAVPDPKSKPSTLQFRVK